MNPLERKHGTVGWVVWAVPLFFEATVEAEVTRPATKCPNLQRWRAARTFRVSDSGLVGSVGETGKESRSRPYCSFPTLRLHRNFTNQASRTQGHDRQTSTH